MIETVNDSVLNIIKCKPGVSRETIYVDCEYEKLDIARSINWLINNAKVKKVNDCFWLYNTIIPITSPVTNLAPVKTIAKNVLKREKYSVKPRKPKYSDDKQSDTFDLLTNFGRC